MKISILKGMTSPYETPDPVLPVPTSPCQQSEAETWDALRQKPGEYDHGTLHTILSDFDSNTDADKEGKGNGLKDGSNGGKS